MVRFFFWTPFHREGNNFKEGMYNFIRSKKKFWGPKSFDYLWHWKSAVPRRPSQFSENCFFPPHSHPIICLDFLWHFFNAPFLLSKLSGESGLPMVLYSTLRNSFPKNQIWSSLKFASPAPNWSEPSRDQFSLESSLHKTNIKRTQFWNLRFRPLLHVKLALTICPFSKIFEQNTEAQNKKPT